MTTDTITLPAYWASALVNGDFSSLTPDEENRCREEIRRLDSEGWSVVSCEDETRFSWSYQLYDPGADCRGGDVLDYTIIR